jgi:hypothetical protein
MALTTFSGPVRSLGGFIEASQNETTGEYTNQFLISTTGQVLGTTKPPLFGLTATTRNTAATLTYVKNVISVNNYTGAAAQTVTLPAAEQGVIVVHAQSVDTTGGTLKLIFDCAGTDVFATGSVFESRATNAVTFDTSTAGETSLEYTPANAATNLFSIGSYIYFTCVQNGTWQISADLNPATTGLTGAFAFAA